MFRYLVTVILSLIATAASAMQISSSLTSSGLSVYKSATDPVPPAFTTDPTGLSPAEWTDLANWNFSLTVHDGHASAGVPYFMYGTLTPFTSLEWAYAGEMAWSGDLNADGSPESGFWTFTSCGSPPILPPGCGDQQHYLGAGSSQQTFAGSVILTNDTDQFVPFSLYGEIHMHADSSHPTPIPEPSTSALMLAGAALVGIAARRRRALAGLYRE
jgi:hypothetical protein